MRNNFDEFTKTVNRNIWLVLALGIFAFLTKLAFIGVFGWLIYYAITRLA